MKRTWRAATAGLATAALLMTAAGPASAQFPAPPDLGDLIPGFGDDDGGGTPLDQLLEALDPDQLQELLDELGLPEDTPLDAIIEAIEDLLGGGLPGDDDEGEDDFEDPGVDEGIAEGEAGPVPDTGMGGFAGYASSSGLVVFVGLPEALADGLAPVLSGLGIAGTFQTEGQTLSGIRIDLSRTEADLERAAAGEEISSEARAFITNLLLASEEAMQPGNCTGAPMAVQLPPDADPPLVELTLANVDCEESDERAFADVDIVGLDIRLGALIELGLPAEVRDGVDELVTQLNEALLDPLSEGLCQVFDALGLPCEDNDTPLLQIGNPFDLDVPVVDLDTIASSAEVVQDGDTLTATATSRLAGVNVLGLLCAGNAEGSGPAVFSSTATTDGETATRSGEAPALRVGNCAGNQNLLTVLLEGSPLGNIGLLDGILQDDLVDGALEPLFDGLDTLLDALTTRALTQGSVALGDVEGAGTSAATNPYVIASTLPLAGIPGLQDVLGDVAVIVAGGETAVGVNAVPAGEEPPVAPPTEPTDPADPTPTPRPLPRTGMGLGVLVGLGALGAAAALRRRED